MPARKKKPVGKTKHEKRRIARRFARQAAGKQPLAEPLRIAPAQERRKALAEGKMVFYDGKQRIELPLLLGDPRLRLNGVYKTYDGRMITFRVGKRFVQVWNLDHKGVEKPLTYGWFVIDSDLGHMKLEPRLREQGIGLKASSKAERHLRARNEGEHFFMSLGGFERLFKRLGYTTRENVVSGHIRLVLMKKHGKEQKLDNLDKYHRIEAIDPKTGKARIFTFTIKEGRLTEV